MDEEYEETKSVGSNGNMSTFEKILHKDNKKLNRLQTQARNYIGTGSYTGDVSKMSSKSRLSSAHSQGALPDLTASVVSRHGPKSSRGGSSALAAIEPTSAMRTSTGGIPGFAKNRIQSSKSSVSSFK